MVRKIVSQRLEKYVQSNYQVAVLKQLHDEGFDLQPEQSAEYLILNSVSKSYWDRVRAAPFLDGNECYYAERYMDIVLRRAGSCCPLSAGPSRA